ncbi:MAG TPA: glycosyltransferase family 4 protein [Burkholderiales bacterium]|nr:glycosyltransferase family 4 protein [Burkholderiales bacterium]
MRLLLSAYACEPDTGSEPGVGWNWAVELAALGHEVWVLTRANNRQRIERALETLDSVLRPNFLYFDLPRWVAWWKRGGRGVQVYYYLWQIGALRVARRAHEELRFDAVQHLTFGVFRQPSLMGRLGIPFVLGPVGGGERTPPRLRGVYSRRERLWEWLRDAANRVMVHDPLVADTYRRATTVLAKTPDTLAVLPAAARGRARCFLEVGLPSATIAGSPSAWTGGTFRLLYVGRFINLKGIALGIRALARLRENGVAVTLSLVGSGPRLQAWQEMARALGVCDRLDWMGWKAQHELPAIYRAHHALLFPSLHDSSGNAVLEGMAQGLPVICLDVGGPSAVAGVDASMVVATAGRSEQEVVAALADAVSGLMASPRLHAAKSAAALERARGMTWRDVVGRLWQPATLPERVRDHA